jgi:ankyrin repeat protein
MKSTIVRTIGVSLVFAAWPGTAADGDVRLIDAARAGDEQAINVLLDSNIDVNFALADGTTALHHAAHRDDLVIARALTQSGINASTANAYGITPLSLACTNRSSEMVALLLASAANPNSASWNNESVLMGCARVGAAGAVEALLDAGADPNVAENSHGQTALMWAAAGGYSSVVQVLLKHGADNAARTIESVDRVPNTCRICDWKPSPGGFTPLMFAARSGDVPSAKFILRAGTDINVSTNEHGNALVIASASGHEEMALFLLANGADPNASDENGVTALHHALQNGLAAMHGVTYDPVYRKRPGNMPGLARALLDVGADVNAQIVKSYRVGPAIRSSCESVDVMVGATPFFLAAVAADVSLIKLLDRSGADPSINTSDGTTPLMVAARAACSGTNQIDNQTQTKKQQSLAAVSTILEIGVDVNAANEVGNTALHKAAFSGAEAVVKILVDNGAYLNAANAEGETPWSMASGISPSLQGRGEYGVHEVTAELLASLGATEITREQMNTPDAYSNFHTGGISIDRENVVAAPQAGE